jgi:hypothetical protein
MSLPLNGKLPREGTKKESTSKAKIASNGSAGAILLKAGLVNKFLLVSATAIRMDENSR